MNRRKLLFFFQNKPVVLHFVSGEQFSSAAWSLTQPHVVFFSTEKGNIQVWDITKRRSEPFQSQNVAGSPINGSSLFYTLAVAYNKHLVISTLIYI